MKQIYTAQEIAQAIPANYASVLAAIQREELPAIRAGGQYVIYAQEAEAYIAQRRLLADPQAIQKLQQEVAYLRAENLALRAGGSV